MLRDLSPRPRLDLLESAAAYELFAEVPGAVSGAADVQFRAGILHVDVQLPPVDAAPHSRLGAVEPRRLWRISVGFGDLVSGERIRAVQADGVLHVHLPKPATAPAAELRDGLEPGTDPDSAS